MSAINRSGKLPPPPAPLSIDSRAELSSSQPLGTRARAVADADSESSVFRLRGRAETAPLPRLPPPPIRPVPTAQSNRSAPVSPRDTPPERAAPVISHGNLQPLSPRDRDSQYVPMPPVGAAAPAPPLITPKTKPPTALSSSSGTASHPTSLPPPPPVVVPVPVPVPPLVLPPPPPLVGKASTLSPPPSPPARSHYSAVPPLPTHPTWLAASTTSPRSGGSAIQRAPSPPAVSTVVSGPTTPWVMPVVSSTRVQSPPREPTGDGKLNSPPRVHSPDSGAGSKGATLPLLSGSQRAMSPPQNQRERNRSSEKPTSNQSSPWLSASQRSLSPSRRDDASQRAPSPPRSDSNASIPASAASAWLQPSPRNAIVPPTPPIPSTASRSSNSTSAPLQSSGGSNRSAAQPVPSPNPPTASTTTSSARSPKAASHLWATEYFESVLSQCFVCGEFLGGRKCEGRVCRHCNLCVHSKCADSVPSECQCTDLEVRHHAATRIIDISHLPLNDISDRSGVRKEAQMEQGLSAKHMKKRYVVLRDDYKLYYYSLKDSRTPRGIVSLSEAVVDALPEQGIIRLVLQKHKAVLLRPKAEDHFRDWMEAFRAAKSQLALQSQRAEYDWKSAKKQTFTLPTFSKESPPAVEVFRGRDPNDEIRFFRIRAQNALDDQKSLLSLSSTSSLTRGLCEADLLISNTNPASYTEEEKELSIEIEYVPKQLVYIIPAPASEKLQTVVTTFLSKFRLSPNSGGSLRPADQFLVKIPNLEEYVLNLDAPLWSLSHFRFAAQRRQPLRLSIVPITSVSASPIYKSDSSQPLNFTDSQMLNSVSIPCIPVSEVDKIFEIRILAIDGISQESLLKYASKQELAEKRFHFCVSAALFHGASAELLCAPQHTASSSDPFWAEWLKFDLPYNKLPRETRLSLSVLVGRSTARDKKGLYSELSHVQSIGVIPFQLSDYRGLMAGGVVSVRMPLDPNHPLRFGPMTSVDSPIQISIEFELTPAPLLYTNTFKLQPPKLSTGQMPRPLKSLLTCDPLVPFSTESRQMVWAARSLSTQLPECIARVMASANPTDQAALNEAHNLLQIWPPIGLDEAIQLLGSRIADTRTREWAVGYLKSQNDRDLVSVIPTLVSLLKFESYHFSALNEFLLLRAVKNPLLFGHILYWALLPHMVNKHQSPRYSILLDAFLSGCEEGIREMFSQQSAIVARLAGIAAKVKEVSKPQQKKDLFESLLRTIPTPNSFSLPHSSRVRFRSIRAERSSIAHSSPTAPVELLLDLEVESPIPNLGTSVLFISGADLRIEDFVSKMISLLDRLWLREHLDLNVFSYNVTSTGDSSGFVECDPNTLSISAIHHLYAKKSTKHSIFQYITDCNEGNFQFAIDRYATSLCGCWLQSVLLNLVVDRSMDNVLIEPSGNLHLWNLRECASHYSDLKRGSHRSSKKSPYLFVTSEMLYALIGEQGIAAPALARSTERIQKGFLIARRHANLILSLQYSSEVTLTIRDALKLNVTDEEASTWIAKTWTESLEK